jgi:hypothetical protein
LPWAQAPGGIDSAIENAGLVPAFVFPIDPVPRQHEADDAEHRLHTRLRQPRPLQAGEIVDRAHRPGADRGRPQPHQYEAQQLRASERGLVAGEGELAVEPVTEQGPGDAAGHVGRLDRHAPVAEPDQHAPVDQPLHPADQQVMPRVASQRHGAGDPRVIKAACGIAVVFEKGPAS